jgi:hypothetical protein
MGLIQIQFQPSPTVQTTVVVDTATGSAKTTAQQAAQKISGLACLAVVARRR